MGAVVEHPTLEHVAMEARPYPTHLLEDCETGLVLFAAAFNGWNDAVHFAEAGMQTTCIDIDGPRLTRMKMLYPTTWVFIEADAWTYAQTAVREDLTWDAVSCDTFTGEAMDKSLQSLALWCSLARKVVTVTLTDDVETINVPDGWESSLYPRSEHVSWLVLTRA